MDLIKSFFIYFLLCFSNLSANEENFNPYTILGLSRTASDQEIRQAYKKLAKHWHPDKNSEPNAHEQFTKINAAYEILSDSTKRQNYDEYGTTSQDNHRGFNTNHFRDPFDMFRAHFFHEAPSGAKKIIHSYEFLKNILPNSDKKPYVIFGSTNFCFHCRQPLTVFRTMEKQFNDVGIGTGEFNANDERLSGELGILSIPSLCVISQGRVYHFDNRDFTETNIKEFVRKSLPTKRWIKILDTPDDISQMIASYNQSNRVHALLITKQRKPTLKFVIPCLQYSIRIQCAIFNSSRLSVLTTDQLPTSLQQISPLSDTILLFKEDANYPDVVIKDDDLKLHTIERLFETNQLLHLPIITSSNVFNLVCPINSAKPCFVIIGDSNLFSRFRSSFVHLSKTFFRVSQSHLAYLHSNQLAWKNLLDEYYQNNEKILRVSTNTNHMEEIRSVVVVVVFFFEKNKILAVRRWLDDRIEIQNTNIEFDEISLRNDHHQIEDNLKFFLNNRWQNAKKYPLPIVFDLDERYDLKNLFIRIWDQVEYRWNYWIERNRFLRYFSSYLYTYQFWLITLFLFVYMYYSRQETDVHSNEISSQVKVYEFNESLLQRYTPSNAPNVIVLLLIADTPKDGCVKDFKRNIQLIKDSRMVYSILFRQRTSTWLDELATRMEEQPTVRFPPSTILALYLRRKFFVSYSNQLTFLDWIDLLLNGNFPNPISVSSWPMKFD